MDDMEIRLTLKADSPEREYVRRKMFEREESARAFTLSLIQESMRRAAKQAPALIRQARKK